MASSKAAASETDPLLPRYDDSTVHNVPQSPRRRGWVEKTSLIALTLVAIVLWLQPKIIQCRWPQVPPPAEPIHVAVIGGGPAGVFAAARLHELSAKSLRPIEVTLFERKSSLGGRLVTETAIHPFDDTRESPLSAEASGYNSLTSDLNDLVPNFGPAGWLSRLWNNAEKTLYIYDEPVELTRPSTAASLGSRLWEFWCFGMSFVGAKSIGSQYRKQIRGLKAIGVQDTVNGIVDSLGLNEPRSQVGADIFAHHGVSKSYINRVIKSEALVQFGQEADSMNPLTLGMMAYAADEGKSQKGGHLISVLENMLSRSRNVHVRLDTEIFGLRQMNSTKWVLASRDSKTLSDQTAHLFDGVILAAPINSLNLSFHGARLPSPNEAIEYRSRHVTWFTSSQPLDSDQVGMKGLKDPKRIITRLPLSWRTSEYDAGAIEIFDMGMHVNRLPYGDVSERLYRVLSDKQVTDENIMELLGGQPSSWIARHNIEDGYPVYGPETSFSPIVLDDRIWHSSAVEQLHSSVGVSAWAGRNVANLAFRKLQELSHD